MKKILSFVLVLAMVLGSVSMAFASSFPDVADTDDCAQAVNVLSALGVVEGYNDGTFKPAKTITRAEAIKIVVAALGIPVTEGNSYPTKFEDVAPTAWYAGYVNYGVAMGITEGTSATRFSPDATVTYDQVITFIMRALGYTDDLVGGYPTGYVVRAYQEGVLDKTMTAGTAPAPRGDIAQVLYNALAKKFVSYDKDLGDFKDNDDKYAADKENMYALLGCDNSTYDLIDSDVITGATMVDLSQYLGAFAQIVKKDDKIVGVGEILTVFVDGKLSSGKLGDYKCPDTAVDGTSAKGGHAFEFFTNGATDTAKTESDLSTSSKFAVILENGSVKEIVSQQVWVADDNFMATKSTVEGLKPEDEDVAPTLNDYAFVVDEDDETKILTNTFILEGVKSIEDIAKDNVVYVYLYPAGSDNAGKISKIEVGTEVAEGKLTAIASNNKSYTVAGTKYSTSSLIDANKLYDDTSKELIGKNVAAYLDASGKLYTVKSIDEDTSNVYGIVLGYKAAGEDELGNAITGQIRLFTADGEDKTYDIKSKVTLAATTKGDLIQISLNSSNLVIDSTSAAIATPTAGSEISKNGVVDGSYIVNSSTKVIVKDDTATAGYTTTSYSKLFGETEVEGCFYKNSSNNVTVFYVTSELKGTKSDLKYAVMTGYEKVEDGANVSMLLDGKNANYTATLADAQSFVLTATSGSATAYSFKINSDNEMTDIVKDENTDGITLTAKSTSVSDAIVKLNNTPYEVAEDIAVYTYDASASTKWTAASGSSKLVGLKSGVTVFFFDTDTDAVGAEIAIVVK